jgi:hypothetical protein
MRHGILLTALLVAGLCVNVRARPAAIPDTSQRYASIDKIALAIPDSQTGNTQQIAYFVNTNFKTDSDKTRAIFVWVASNIQYDIDNMYVYAQNNQVKIGDIIIQALKTRKGICQHFAEVFNDICLKSGLQSYVIGGYTKHNGVINKLSHAWCATRVDGQWFLFDPTWGSGYVSHGRTIREIRDSFYKVPPSQFIKSHMPFDPMWELLNYPLTNQEFCDGNTTENKSKKFFGYADSINAYEHLDEAEQCLAASRRIKANGVTNALVSKELQSMEMYNSNKEAEVYNEKLDLYESAGADYNDGVKDFNKFIQYKTARSQPAIPDAETQATIDSAYTRIMRAKTKMGSIKEPDANLSRKMAPTIKLVDELLVQIQEQKDWLQKNPGKGK